MEIRKILIGVVLVIVLFMIYRYFKDENDKVLFSVRDARVLKTIQAAELPEMKTVDYTYSIWFYVNDWNYRYGEQKVLYGRVNSDNNPGPSVIFSPSVNNINVSLASYSKDGKSEVSHCVVENVPLQRWTHLLISLNNRALDVYIDGKLVKTCMLPGVPKVDIKNPLMITPDGGFAGYVSSLRVIGGSINPTEAYNIYKEGYGGSSGLLNQYKVKMSLLKDDTEYKSLEL
jgi:hypothetical protein